MSTRVPGSITWLSSNARAVQVSPPILTRPPCASVRSTTTPFVPTRAAVPVRRRCGMCRWRRAIGRRKARDAMAAAMKTISATPTPAPAAATAAASTAASATGPRKKSPGVRISPIASPTATIAQITQAATGQMVVRAGLFLDRAHAPLGDVADAHDPDGAAVGDDRQVAEAVLEHRLRSLGGARLLVHRDRVGGHPLAYARLARVRPPGRRAHQVALREDSDQAAEVHHDGGADSPLDHLLRRLAEGVLGSHGQDVPRHQVADPFHGARITRLFTFPKTRVRRMRRMRITIRLLLCLAALAVVGTAVAVKAKGQFRGALDATTHTPTVNARWTYYVSARTLKGKRLHASAHVQVFEGSKRVNIIGWHQFTGSYHQSYPWPVSTRGHPYTFQVLPLATR